MSAAPAPQHRTYTWHDLQPTAEAIQRLSGLEVLRGIGDGTLPTPPAMDTLAIEPVEIEPGRVVFELTTGLRRNCRRTAAPDRRAPPTPLLPGC